MDQHVRRTLTSHDAVLQAGDWRFYYGPAFAPDATGVAQYGFEVGTGAEGVVFRMAYSEMAQQPWCPPRLDPQGCLVFGLGLWWVATQAGRETV